MFVFQVMGEIGPGSYWPLSAGEERANRDKAAKIRDPHAVGGLEGRPAMPGVGSPFQLTVKMSLQITKCHPGY